LTTVDRFSRSELDKAFGSGTSSQGFTKHGKKTGEVVASSPAVKADLVKVRADGHVDQRCVRRAAEKRAVAASACRTGAAEALEARLVKEVAVADQSRQAEATAAAPTAAAEQQRQRDAQQARREAEGPSYTSGPRYGYSASSFSSYSASSVRGGTYYLDSLGNKLYV
jgi:hypothetical protein